jgi:hypothetical protein
MLTMPVQSPDRAPKPLTATRRDGTTVDIRKTVAGLSAADPDDMGVHDWEAI